MNKNNRPGKEQGEMAPKFLKISTYSQKKKKAMNISPLN
jgi:hypothetical protein